MTKSKLTKEDLLAAAAQAEIYPPEYAYDWGYGPLEHGGPFQVAVCVRDDAALLQYG